MIGPDDSRLTTHALDELEGEERLEFEKALADSDELTREAQDIRRAAGMLKTAFAQEHAESRPPAKQPSPGRARSMVAVVGLAAMLAIVGTAALFLRDVPEDAPALKVTNGLPAQATYPPPPPLPPKPVELAPPSLGRDQLKALGYISEELSIEGGVAGGVAGGVMGGMAGGFAGSYAPPFNTEGYAYHADSDFVDVVQNPLSTFSLDVDTASYANVRRFLNDGHLPPIDAVRIEEMVNYFSYDYAPPQDARPFAAHLEMAAAPWNNAHRLLRIGLKARELPRGERPDSNLVFLVDVSGSMQPANKLPLVKRALGMLVEQLTAHDHVAMVVYAGAAGCVLPSTSGADTPKLLDAIERLSAGGSTNGGEGIALAYQLAQNAFIPGGVNRVILATDGDFNVGTTDHGSLVRLIEEKAKSGVFLSIFGFGMGNYKDDTLELLADKGNGNYGYIDTANEARKALVEEMNQTLVTVAKDVKIQVEWNPARVQSYRLIGYENRRLRPEEFNDDKKDAGEVGAGHDVTALYEIIPAASGETATSASVDPLVYQKPPERTAASLAAELMRLKLRYKEPEGAESRLLEWTVEDRITPLAEASRDFRFAAAVAGFGLWLRDSPYKGDVTLDGVAALAQDAIGADLHGYRAELVSLVKKAKGQQR